MRWQDEQARERVVQVEQMLSRLDALADPAARTQALGTVTAVVELYGQCLARIIGHVTESADAAPTAAIVADELVGHLLLVHDLHPEPAEVRVRRALEAVPGAELLGVEQSVARVRLGGGAGGSSCGSSVSAMRRPVEEAVTRAAPEIERVEIADDAPGGPQALIPVESLFVHPEPPAARPVSG
jgi:hypothetical protein